jgi:catechol 2,3-dioxygenase-like lactoylglutathione lyase family enzyme
MQIDHVELFVPDRYEAAEWYGRVLGLQVVKTFEHWAANPRGPLMLATDAGGTKLALFEGEPQHSRPTSGFHRVAFGASSEEFVAFLRRLGGLDLIDERGGRVSIDSVIDHTQAYSIYFCDPFGHRLEITTYEHEAVRTSLARREGAL